MLELIPAASRVTALMLSLLECYFDVASVAIYVTFVYSVALVWNIETTRALSMNSSWITRVASSCQDLTKPYIWPQQQTIKVTALRTLRY
jgi:hypothetical protein